MNIPSRPTVLSKGILPLFLGGVLGTLSFSWPGHAAAQAPQQAATESAAQRSKDLSALFSDIWEDGLKHSPEYASTLGDKRYNDQLSDYSVKEVNASLERGRKFIERLSTIDTTGLSEQEQLSAELMLALADRRPGGAPASRSGRCR